MPTKSHHTATGFRNNYIDSVTKSLGDVLRWQWQRIRDRLPPKPTLPTPQATAELDFIRRNAAAGTAMQPAVSWIGHATMLVQASGLNVLTDPVFSARVSPVQFAGPSRAQPPGIELRDLPHIDVVVISHNHYDHLDRASVKSLANQAGGVEFQFTPAQHWSGRSLSDRNKTLWGAWAVLGADFHWFFTGDTGYSKDFEDARERFDPRQAPERGGGFDIALIAVGACLPRWFMKDQHVDLAEAVQIHRDLGAKRSVGVHWGTFALADDPLDQPLHDLAGACRDKGVAEESFFLLPIGGTRLLPRRGYNAV
jgi:N-acyl-phosphatidylethanolamine-hydrolysing phospholipase D